MSPLTGATRFTFVIFPSVPRPTFACAQRFAAPPLRTKRSNPELAGSETPPRRNYPQHSGNGQSMPVARASAGRWRCSRADVAGLFAIVVVGVVVVVIVFVRCRCRRGSCRNLGRRDGARLGGAVRRPQPRRPSGRRGDRQRAGHVRSSAAARTGKGQEPIASARRRRPWRELSGARATAENPLGAGSPGRLLAAAFQPDRSRRWVSEPRKPTRDRKQHVAERSAIGHAGAGTGSRPGA